MPQPLDHDPLVIVVRNRHQVKGADHPADPVPKHDPMPLSEALSRRWKCYAHLAIYTVPNEERWPRLNKPCLPLLRERGVEPFVELTACDYDNDNHAPLDKEGYMEFVERVRDAPILQPTLIYKTRSGARLLFVHPAVTPEKAEVLHRSIVHAYMREGIPLDQKVWPWNTLAALPWVVRDGEALDPRPLSWGECLDAVPELPEPPPALRVTPTRRRIPKILDAEALVWRDDNVLTEWGRKAKARMKNRDAEVCFDRATSPTLTKNRNPTLFAWAGSLVALLHGVEDTTPEHLFGVLCPTVEASLRNNDRDLFHETWKAINYCWNHEDAKATANEEATRSFMEELRFRATWAKTAPTEQEAFAAWIRKRLIALSGTDCYVLQENGLYNPVAVKPLGLISKLRDSGLVGAGRVLPDLLSPTKGGGVLSSQGVIDRFATVVQAVEVRPLGFVGGRLVDRPSGDVLEVSPFARRDDLPRKHSDLVQEWLQALMLCHLPAVEALELWIAAALAPEKGPVCALSILGPSGVGKDLVAVALANCFTTRRPAAASIFGKFQYGVDRNAVVHVNEAWPEGVAGVDKRLRELIGGASFEVNQKFSAYVQNFTFLRIVMTANTDAVVSKLFARRGMSEDERRAVLQRVMHFDVTVDGEHPAREVFRRYKDRLWKADLIEEVSSHFLWLHDQLKPTLKDRFLVMGDESDPILSRMAFGDDDQAEVGELLVAFVNAGRLPENHKVTAGELWNYADSLLNNRWKRFNLIALGRVLEHFRVTGTKKIDLARLRTFARAAELKLVKQKEVAGAGRDR